MDDAAEALEAILSNAHEELVEAGQRGKFVPTGQPAGQADWSCVYDNLAVSIFERGKCPDCSSATPKLQYEEVVCYVTVETLIDGVGSGGATAAEASNSHAFESAILNAKASSMSCPKSEKKECPHTQPILLERAAPHLPPTFILGLAWPSAQASRDLVRALLGAVALRMDMAKMFHGTALRTSAPASLVGMLCFYGSHYLAFWNTPEWGWTSFDDATVKTVGAWEDVVAKCHRGHLQPLLLFYTDDAAEAAAGR
jgi:hypothetical protein